MPTDPLLTMDVPILRVKGKRVLSLPLAVLGHIVLDLMREPRLIASRSIQVKDALPMEFDVLSMEVDPEGGMLRFTLESAAWPAGEMDGSPISPALGIVTEPRAIHPAMLS